MSEGRLPAEEWDKVYEQLDPIAKQHAALSELWAVYLLMAAWGTPDYENENATDQATFRELVETDRLYEYVEEAKRRVLQSGLDVPDRWLWPIGSAIRSGQAVRDWERHEILQIATEILCHLPRLRPDAQPQKSSKGGDTFRDTQKKTGKKLRRPRVEHADCERIYRDAKKKGFPLNMKQVVAEYLEANPECEIPPEGLLRGWKDFRKLRREGDNSGTL